MWQQHAQTLQHSVIGETMQGRCCQVSKTASSSVKEKERLQRSCSSTLLVLHSNGKKVLEKRNCTAKDSAECLSAGSTLRDVTDGVGLVANERTLACACLADRLLLQVMHKRMQLFTMDAALAPDQGTTTAPV